MKRKIYLTINALKNNSNKIQAVRSVLVLLSAKQTSNLSQFYKIIHEGLDKKILLSRFKKAMVIKKIL